MERPLTERGGGGMGLPVCDAGGPSLAWRFGSLSNFLITFFTTFFVTGVVACGECDEASSRFVGAALPLEEITRLWSSLGLPSNGSVFAVRPDA